MKNKGQWFLLFLCCFLFLTGCKEEQTENSSKTSMSDTINTTGSGTLKCTREATAKEGIDVSLNYEVSYKNGNITILHSLEKVISTAQEDLDEYETAYQKIYKNYEGLKYYDNKITRTENSVTSDTTINYEKINIEKLIEIEGEEDNVIENGKVKLKSWLDFAEKFGTNCEEVK